ncbi:MAG: hypothetical protein H0X63_02300 [Flavobacteriales bacterium]|nr:hypothetical protein [Flavobacteriales bacterium]
MVYKNKQPYIKAITIKLIGLLLFTNIGLLQAQYTLIPDPILKYIVVQNNSLEYLNVANGNNTNFTFFSAGECFDPYKTRVFF